MKKAMRKTTATTSRTRIKRSTAATLSVNERVNAGWSSGPECAREAIGVSAFRVICSPVKVCSLGLLQCCLAALFNTEEDHRFPAPSSSLFCRPAAAAADSLLPTNSPLANQSRCCCLPPSLRPRNTALVPALGLHASVGLCRVANTLSLRSEFGGSAFSR